MQVSNDKTSFQGIIQRSIRSSEQKQITARVDKYFDSYVSPVVEKLEKLGTDILIKGDKENGVNIELSQFAVADTFTPKNRQGNPINISIKNMNEIEGKLTIFNKKIQGFLNNPNNKHNEAEFQKSVERAETIAAALDAKQNIAIS